MKMDANKEAGKTWIHIFVIYGLYMHLWDSIPGRSYQGKWAGYCQLMTEPQPTLAGYGEVLVLQQDGCGLCSRWILSWRSMVYTTRCCVEELLQNQPTAKSPCWVLVLQQDGCGLCSRWILSWRSMVHTTRCCVEELLQNQPTAKITLFSQQTTATICSTGDQQLVPAIERPGLGNMPDPVRLLNLLGENPEFYFNLEFIVNLEFRLGVSSLEVTIQEINCCHNSWDPGSEDPGYQSI